MVEIAIWAWIIFLGLLFCGWHIFIYFGIGVVTYFLIMWLKPEWLDKF